MEEQFVLVHTNREQELEEPMFLRMIFLRWADHVRIEVEPLPIHNTEGQIIGYDSYSKHLNETVALCKTIDGRIEKILPEYLTFE